MYKAALTAVALVMMLGMVFEQVFAEVATDKYKKIQEEIKIHKDKLESSEKKELSVLDELEKADEELKQITRQIEKEKAQVVELEENVKAVRQDMLKTEKTIITIRASLKKRLQAIQRRGFDVDKIVILLNIESFYDMLRTTRYLSKMSGSEYNQMWIYQDLSNKLSEKEKKLQSLAAQLKSKAEKLKNSEAALAQKKREREEILHSVRKEKALYSSMLKELEATSNRFTGFLEKKENEMTKKENEASGAGKDFKALKGKLAWPVQGNVAIPYGTHQDPQFKTPVYRNGIYITSEQDPAVKAVYDGKVVFADVFKGLGQVVILSHGMGYHTVYANLSTIFAKAGDIVKARTTIGSAGTSSLINDVGIYFEIRYKGKPINPLQWLKREN
ncbi:murein hydrolase activator EnvC family protein [Candidatus Magnetominusculus xianensis]|uniref:Peptidase M23 n=1 Tax=Candidatus Magnetominusculus xianensis TaxID=1748249 RepID=A0ABR5SIW6_9BACT|nr:peptidoglycan DD-metalloendopeptidase family protein [Candidatus Magnetominusculus xianensis]KWT84421.1 peptidase M23 [Candidatus Magnetominusculus xianensis]MBF0404255.1 peptidoglycan DD-metalloendopeptidase family protein [Nitrospirota bacterium]